jgi:hypothetical protein
MAQVNPDPHAQGYVFIPTNRVTGLFSSYDDLQGVLRPYNRWALTLSILTSLPGRKGQNCLTSVGNGMASPRGWYGTLPR